MAYEQNGIQPMFPIRLSRMASAADGLSRERYDIAVAQNEANLNQNLDTLYRKLTELEAYLADLEKTNGGGESE